MTKIFAILSLIFILGPAQSARGSDFKCDRGIVSVGDRKSEVYFKCGEPEWKNARTEEVVQRLDDGHWVKRYVDIEEWLYNYGPTRFMRILTFQQNRLRDIEMEGYGYGQSDFKPGKECMRGIEKGDRQPEVIARCGPPSFVEHYDEEHVKKTDQGRFLSFNVQIDEWTYDFGPDRFLRILKFENGRLVGLEEDGYGYYR